TAESRACAGSGFARGCVPAPDARTMVVSRILRILDIDDRSIGSGQPNIQKIPELTRYGAELQSGPATHRLMTWCFGSWKSCQTKGDKPYPLPALVPTTPPVYLV